MNWQTEKIFDEAREAIGDEGVFSYDQIAALKEMITTIEKAVAMESRCIGSGINHIR